MCDPAPWCAYVMSVTTAPIRGAVSSVEARESRMPITVRSAPSRRRIEMVARRLSIWGALRQISSMNEKNTASRRGDWWVTSFSPPQAAAAARKDAYYCQQKGSRVQHTARTAVSTLAPLHPALSSHPDKVVGMEKDSSQGAWQPKSEEKMTG